MTRRQLLGAVTGIALIGSGLSSPARGLTINPRSSWAIDRPPKGPLDTEDVRFLIVHHSASHNGHSGADVPRILQGFYDYHTSDQKGWNDIAYNFLIDSQGGIWEGRAGSLDGPIAGDATGGNQGYTQLVCIIGDYNTAQPTDASLSSLVALLASLADRYDLSTAPGAEVEFPSRGSNLHAEGTLVRTPTITGHRTMSQTSCPGDHLDAYVVGGLTADVETARDPQSSSTTTTTTSSTTIASTTTTTFPQTTTTMQPASTTSSSATTTGPVTTLPVATESPAVSSGLPFGLAATAGAVALTGAGLLLWRQRRMKD